MKLLITLCLIASLATVAWSRNAFFGHYANVGSIVKTVTVVREAEKNKAWNELVQYAGKDFSETVVAILVEDNYRNNSGALAFLHSGGPGFKYANVILRSGYEEGIESTVTFYGNVFAPVAIQTTN